MLGPIAILKSKPVMSDAHEDTAAPLPDVGAGVVGATVAAVVGAAVVGGEVAAVVGAEVGWAVVGAAVVGATVAAVVGLAVVGAAACSGD